MRSRGRECLIIMRRLSEENRQKMIQNNGENERERQGKIGWEKKDSNRMKKWVTE